MKKRGVQEKIINLVYKCIFISYFQVFCYLQTIAFGADPKSSLRLFFPSFLSRATPEARSLLKNEVLVHQSFPLNISGFSDSEDVPSHDCIFSISKKCAMQTTTKIMAGHGIFSFSDSKMCSKVQTMQVFFWKKQWQHKLYKKYYAWFGSITWIFEDFTYIFQVLPCLVTCLMTDKMCFSVWRQMYIKHLPQSRYGMVISFL